MKEFFKFMFASMLGFFLSVIILSVILFTITFAIIAVATSNEVTVPKNCILQIKLDRPINDRSPRKSVLLGSYSMGQGEGLATILKSIHTAKKDASIKGILLDISEIDAGLSTIDEIRDALIDFRKSGKFIYSYSESYSQGAYYLASASDQIYLQPQGILFFKGLDAELAFIKGTLEKLDIQMQVVRHGKFKSATEPLFLDKMSNENRQQITALINNSWGKIVEGISLSRGISKEKLNLLADSLSAMNPQGALKNRLVDKLAYKDELLKDLRQKLGIAPDKDIPAIKLERYADVPEIHGKSIGKEGKIAVIFATGSISGGNGDDQSIGSERLSKAIRKAREDKKVKAIVFRINSGGGSALASDVIWREVSLAAQAKPVVASFGDVAGSGGYYIGCAATRIVANPTTLTGSIGVFGVVPNMKGLFNNKLGITFDEAKTNANSEYIPVSKPMSPYQSKVLQAEIENIYSAFISKVAVGRHLTEAAVDSIGQGRIWCGNDAKKIGLIDELGGYDKAIEIAATLAGVKNYGFVYLPEQKEPFQELIDQFTGDESRSALQKELGEYYRYYEYLQELRQMKGVQARMPFVIDIR